MSGISSPIDHPRIYRLPEAGSEVWGELERAHRLIGEFGDALRSYWQSDLTSLRSSALSPVLSPFRCLVLAGIGRQSALGVTPTRLARLLGIPTSLLDYHLSRLERAGMVEREAARMHDGRRVRIRLTWRGGEALAAAARVLTSTLGREENGVAGDGLSPTGGDAPPANGDQPPVASS